MADRKRAFIVSPSVTAFQGNFLLLQSWLFAFENAAAGVRVVKPRQRSKNASSVLLSPKNEYGVSLSL